jgi:hypothetical protein
MQSVAVAFSFAMSRENDPKYATTRVRVAADQASLRPCTGALMNSAIASAPTPL